MLSPIGHMVTFLDNGTTLAGRIVAHERVDARRGGRAAGEWLTVEVATDRTTRQIPAAAVGAVVDTRDADA